MMCFMAASVPALAEESDEFDKGFFALPLELDSDFGAANGDATIFRILPVYTYPVRDKWRLAHATIITLADAPSGTPVFPGEPDSSKNTGLADLLHASFYTPARQGNLIWGVGLMAGTANGIGERPRQR